MKTKNLKKTKIREELLNKIRDDQSIVAGLSVRFDKREATVLRWIGENNDILTTVDALKIISNALDISVKDLTEVFIN